MNPFENVPPTLWALFAGTITILLTTLLWFVRGVKSDQAKIATVLDNHLGEISTHMAGTNEILRLIQTELLSAALESKKK